MRIAVAPDTVAYNRHRSFKKYLQELPFTYAHAGILIVYIKHSTINRGIDWAFSKNHSTDPKTSPPLSCTQSAKCIRAGASTRRKRH